MGDRTLRAALLAALVAALCLPASAGQGDRPIYLLFTADVESTSHGGPARDIWGRLEGEEGEHGIGRIMDIFDARGAKATFFVNVYESATHGDDALAEACREIHRRGHDLQLHTHPQPMFGVWGMSQAPRPKQVEILARGRELIKEWTGVEAVVHRAGAYAANGDTIAACRDAGITADFSYNHIWPECVLRKTGLTVNAPVVSDGVLCVPVTCYTQASAGKWRSLRFLDIEASSPQEIRKVVADLHAHGVRTAVVMMHSFGFVRSGKPNLRAERALDELLAGFTADPAVRIVTAAQLHAIWKNDPAALVGEDHLPTTGWWLTYARAWQRLGEGWKNAAVAFTPPGAAVLAFAAVVLWRRRRRKRAAGG